MTPKFPSSQFMDISIISWIHNCEDTVEELYTEITKAMEMVGGSYEIILVNDGSSDNSWKVIQAIHRSDPHVKAINFRRNHGHSSGLQAGFDIAKGNLIFTISSTLENSPKEIVKFIEKMKEADYDLIVGFRKNKLKGRGMKSRLSILANKFVSVLVGKDFKDVTSPIRLIKKEVLKHFRLYGDNHLFLPVLATLSGAKFGEVEVEHLLPKNKSYTYSGLPIHKAVLDIMVLKFFISAYNPPFNTSPIRVFGSMGILTMLLSVILAMFLGYDKFFIGNDIGGRPLLFVFVLMSIVGILLVIIGLLGELLLRIYLEGKDKTYSVKDFLN